MPLVRARPGRAYRSNSIVTARPSAANRSEPGRPSRQKGCCPRQLRTDFGAACIRPAGFGLRTDSWAIRRTGRRYCVFPMAHGRSAGGPLQWPSRGEKLVEIRAGSLDFSQPLSGAGPRQASSTVVFPLAVTAATAGLAGYLAEFSGGNDHNVGRLEITLDTTIAQNTVTVDGAFGLRDWSGNWDDAYDGNIDFVVVAELES